MVISETAELSRYKKCHRTASLMVRAQGDRLKRRERKIRGLEKRVGELTTRSDRLEAGKAHMQRALLDRRNQVKRLNRKIVKLEAEKQSILTRLGAAATQVTEVARLTDEIAQSTTLLEAQKILVVETSALLKAQKVVVVNQAATLRAREITVMTLQGSVKSRVNEVTKRGRIIKELKATLAGKEPVIETLTATVAEKDVVIEGLRAEVDKDTIILAQKKELAALRAQVDGYVNPIIADQAKELVALRAQVAGFGGLVSPEKRK